MADPKVTLEANEENVKDFAAALGEAFQAWHDKRGNPFLSPDLIIYTVAGLMEHLLSGGPCPACKQQFLAQGAGVLMQMCMQMGEQKHAADEVRH